LLEEKSVILVLKVGDFSSSKPGKKEKARRPVIDGTLRYHTLSPKHTGFRAN
jgi:hypothetical protein